MKDISSDSTLVTGSPDGGPSADMEEPMSHQSPPSIRFVVPGQPQGKGRPRVGTIGGHARMFTPQKTVAYEGFIALQAQIAMAGHDLLEGPVEVRMFIACQVPASWSQKKQRDALAGLVVPTSKPDIDNVVKAVFDGINGVVWRDDVLVVDLALRKRYSASPRVEVEIVPLQPETIARPPAAVQADLLAETT